MNSSSIPLIVRRTIPATSQKIFNAFSKPDVLPFWFTPSEDITLDVLEFQFEVGGSFRLRYNMPDGRQPIVGGVYKLIESPVKIVMSWIWEAPDPLAGIPMMVTFQFIETGQSTEVVVTHDGIPSDASCSIHEGGWEHTLNTLDNCITETFNFSDTEAKPS